jgi:Ethanolamine utilization protein EutJ (predicted chaperonin)
MNSRPRGHQARDLLNHAGKGDKNRVKNTQAFRDNYDKIDWSEIKIGVDLAAPGTDVTVIQIDGVPVTVAPSNPNVPPEFAERYPL